jgi:putative ABC transport system substrate-binding protein
MRRREFIVWLGGAAAGYPLAVRAQQVPMPVIGYLGNASPDAWTIRLQAFRRGLKEAGFVEGKNVTIEFRWSDGNYDRLPELAADLVRRRVDVIVTPGSTASAFAAQAATKTIPIVFETGADPIASGLVASLNRPGGNITGVTSLNNEVGPKRLEALHEAIPSAKVVAALVNPAAGAVSERQTTALAAVASKMGLELLVLQVTDDRALETAFSTVRQRASAVIIITDAFFLSRTERLAALTLKNAMPSIFQNRAFAAAGGLMSYGGDPAETHALAGLYVARILKGAKPADLPVIQGTKAELVINLKTAKALGIELPQALLARADEVIE